MAMFLFASLCCAQEPGSYQPAVTNVWGAQYPRIDSACTAQFRVKAPDATTVRLNFWSGPKLDMVKQPDGFWTVTTPPLVPGFHYYTLSTDRAEVTDLNSHAFFGGGKDASGIEVPEAATTFYSIFIPS
jgi:enterochelin esterase family protein